MVYRHKCQIYLAYSIKTRAHKGSNYPFQALEEIIANALYHLDYQIREPVEIRIYTDEMGVGYTVVFLLSLIWRSRLVLVLSNPSSLYHGFRLLTGR